MSAWWSLNLSSVRSALAPPLLTAPSITPSHGHPPSTSLAFCLSQLLLFNAVWPWSLEIVSGLVMWKRCAEFSVFRNVSVHRDVDGFIEVRCDRVWLGENVMVDWNKAFVSGCPLLVSDTVAGSSHWAGRHLVNARLWLYQMYMKRVNDCCTNGKWEGQEALLIHKECSLI